MSVGTLVVGVVACHLGAHGGGCSVPSYGTGRLLRCVFPALRALRFCDASRPVMDKIFFLSHRTTEAIIRSQDVLNDPNLFGALKSDRNLQTEGNVILGGDSDDDEGEDVVFEVALPPSGDEGDSDEEE